MTLLNLSNSAVQQLPSSSVLEKCRRELDSIPDEIIETEEGTEIRISDRQQQIAVEIEQVAQEVHAS